jgi:hypothetical protein
MTRNQNAHRASVPAFQHIPKELRGAAVGLLALLRNEGGSVGTSVAQTIQERREQFHTLRLNEKLDAFNPAVNSSSNTDRRFSCNTTAMPRYPANSPCKFGTSPSSAGLIIGVFRRLLVIGCHCDCIAFDGAADATIGGGKGSTRRGGMTAQSATVDAETSDGTNAWSELDDEVKTSIQSSQCPQKLQLY